MGGPGNLRFLCRISENLGAAFVCCAEWKYGQFLFWDQVPELSEDTQRLLDRAQAGDRSSLGQLLEVRREQLTRIVRIRMGRRLQSRVDASDVVQDAFVEAMRRFDEFQQQSKFPFFIWLRLITLQKLAQLQRFHLGTQARDAAREVSIDHAPVPQATSAVLAGQLLGTLTSPTRAVARDEEKALLEQALNEMDETDREVLVLRHFEKLEVSETANLLDLSESGTRKRYVRALTRLKNTFS